MREAVNFLTQVYYGSVEDVANIKVAEADDDQETIENYLIAVREYASGLLNKLREKRNKNESNSRI